MQNNQRYGVACVCIQQSITINRSNVYKKLFYRDTKHSNSSTFIKTSKMNILLFVLISLLVVINASSVNANSTEIKMENLEEEFAYQSYLDIDETLKMIVRSGVKMAYPYIIETNAHVNLTATCRRDIFHLISDVSKLKLSALKCEYFNFILLLSETNNVKLTILISYCHYKHIISRFCLVLVCAYC